MFQCVLGVRIVNRMEFKDQEDAARLSSTSTNSVGHNGAGFLQRRHNREGEAGNRLPEETIGRASPQQRQFYETPLESFDLLLTGDGQRHQGLATGNLTNAHIRLRLIGDTETSEGRLGGGFCFQRTNERGKSKAMSSQLHTKGPGEGTSLKMPPMLKTNVRHILLVWLSSHIRHETLRGKMLHLERGESSFQYAVTAVCVCARVRVCVCVCFTVTDRLQFEQTDKEKTTNVPSPQTRLDYNTSVNIHIDVGFVSHHLLPHLYLQQTEKSSGHKHPEESDPVRVGRNRRHQARIHGTRRLMEEEEDDEEAGKNTRSTECDTAASARSEQKQRAVGGGRTEKK
ncbi:Hypothetical protein SMAX5B_005565 [Scophthalmus maximus]|uniref:Uncharacterized protein n=1 Tax=Scophthalmus maximus TaxID=52904 RepID=A0A2U9BFD8_SCOMX|nr:Hypothetical protein SMAX5B_005565 [Scophthalmus maximus]